jgi:hypothetical protein
MEAMMAKADKRGIGGFKLFLGTVVLVFISSLFGMLLASAILSPGYDQLDAKYQETLQKYDDLLQYHREECARYQFMPICQP